MHSESVEFDRRLGDALFGEEVGDLKTLITLELDDLAEFFVVNKSAVACKILSPGSQPSGSCGVCGA